MQELFSLIHSKNILIACIQESKLKSTKVLPTNSFPNYTAVRKNRSGDAGGGGIVTLIHIVLSYDIVPS